MAKHHHDLDLSGLVMGEVEKELVADRPSKAIVENVTEEATNIAGIMEKAKITTLADPVLNKQ